MTIQYEVDPIVTRLSLSAYRKMVREFPTRTGGADYTAGWLYLTQACRNVDGRRFGYVIHGEGFTAGLGEHNSHLVLVRPLGTVPSWLFPTLAELIQLTNARPYVFVKQATRSMRAQIRDKARMSDVRILGGRDYGWDTGSPHDDQTYPDVLMPVAPFAKLEEARGDWARRIRSKVRQAKRSPRSVAFTTVGAVARGRVEQLVRDHFGADHAYVESYVNIIASISRPGARDTWSHFVPVMDDEPVGLYAYERVDAVSAAVYASIAHRECVGLSEGMMVEMARRMANAGITMANLGGSEKESLHRYKLKFACGVAPRARRPIVVLDVGTR